jgi:hypothetical protein
VEVASKSSAKKSASKSTPREAAAAKKGKVPTLKIKFESKKGRKVLVQRMDAPFFAYVFCVSLANVVHVYIVFCRLICISASLGE